MKKSVVLMTCAMIVIAAACLADGADEKAGREAFRSVVAALMKDYYWGCDIRGMLPPLQKGIDGARLSRDEALAQMSMIAHEHRRKAEKAVAEIQARDPDDVFANEENTHLCVQMLELTAAFGGREAVSLLDGMAGSAVLYIRMSAVRLCFQVAGADSMPVVEKVLDNPQGNSHEKRHALETFGKLLKQEKNGNHQKNLAEQYAFLLGKAVQKRYFSEALDKTLCELLPGYATSVQRGEAADAMSESKVDVYRNMGSRIKREIEMTPRAERKDFRARGGLLDAGRKKGQGAP
jgi:hypothetical protein